MKKVKTTQKEIEEVDDILCNKCGASLKVFMDRDHTMFNYVGLCEVEVSGAYCSQHIQDEELYRFSLCEKCCKELIDSFVIPAEYEDMLYSNWPLTRKVKE